MMVYARVHDQTVADDYYSAMERVEQRLLVPAQGQIAPLVTPTKERNDEEPLNDDERGQLLDLADQLAAPGLSLEARTELVEQIRRVLNHNPLPEKEEPIQQENGRQPRGPPQPSPAFPWATAD